MLALRMAARATKNQPGVIDVPDLFGVVIGPSSVIVNGDVYLTLVPQAHPRRTARPRAAAMRGDG